MTIEAASLHLQSLLGGQVVRDHHDGNAVGGQRAQQLERAWNRLPAAFVFGAILHRDLDGAARVSPRLTRRRREQSSKPLDACRVHRQPAGEHVLMQQFEDLAVPRLELLDRRRGPARFDLAQPRQGPARGVRVIEERVVEIGQDDLDAVHHHRSSRKSTVEAPAAPRSSAIAPAPLETRKSRLVTV